MSLIRKRNLLGRYLGIPRTFVDLGAFLVKRETRAGQQLFIEDITAGGIIHSSGIKESDRVTSVNLNTNVDQLPFDLLVDAIYSLRPLVLELERVVNGEVIPIVVILDVALEEDKTPYLKFGGFYWNVKYQDIRNFIPLEPPLPPLVTYSYTSKEENQHFYVTENNTKYYLEVNNFVIDFTTSAGTLTDFTVYKYTPSTSPGNNLTTILVPKDQPDLCIAATANDNLELLSFDEGEYTGTNIPAGPRFLEFAKQPNDLYYIDSTVKNDSRITKVDMKAELKPTGSLFTWE